MAFRKRVLVAAVCALHGAALGQTPADPFFDDSVLHEIRIAMSDANWQALKAHYLDNTYFNVDSFQWKGPGSNTLTVTNLQIRSRGRGSRSPVKPSIHVDFNRLNTSQTFLGLSEVDLKANTQDASMLHERLSMKLFTRMGVPASREAPARLYVNDTYIGLYNIVESPDTQMIKRLFNETMRAGNGFLYEYSPDWPLPFNGQWHFEYIGGDLDKYASATAASPFNPQTPNSNSPDTVTLEAWIRTMNQAADADFISQLTPYLEPKPFLTHVAVETYLADFDCILGDIFGVNNFFLYRFQNKPLSILLAWDKDNALSGIQRPILQNADKNVLMRRLLAIPEYKNYYFDALDRTTTLAGGSGGWLEQEASRMYSQVKQAAYDDPNKQYLDQGLLLPSTNDRFDANAADAIRFGAARTQFVMSDLAAQGYRSSPTLTAGSLANGATYVSGGLTPGSWAQVKGTGLSPVSRIWGAADFQGLGNALPTSLSGVSVMVNQSPAAVYFVDPAQVSFQVPNGASGTVSVQVINNGQASNTITATAAASSPGIFPVTVNGTNYPAGVFLDGKLVGDPAVNAAFRKAKPGDLIQLYATGLIATPAGVLPSSQSVSGVTVTIGPSTVPAIFAGLVAVGEFQINVTVPPLSDGVYPVSIALNGLSSPQEINTNPTGPLVIPIQH